MKLSCTQVLTRSSMFTIALSLTMFFHWISNVSIKESNAQKTSYTEIRKREADKLSNKRNPSIPYPEKAKLLNRALAIYREIADRDGEIKVLKYLASIDALMFRHAKAVEKLRLALQITKLFNNRTKEFELLISGVDTGDMIYPLTYNRTTVYIYLLIHDPLSADIVDRIESISKNNALYKQYNLCRVYGDIGYTYLQKKLYKQSIQAYKNGVTECKNSDSYIRNEDNKYKYHEYLAYIGIIYKFLGQEIEFSESILDEFLISYNDLIFNHKKYSTLNNYYLNNLDSFSSNGGICEIYIKAVIARKSEKLLQNLGKSRCSDPYFIAKSYQFFGDYMLAITYYEKALENNLNIKSEYRRPKDWRHYEIIKYKHLIARMYESLGTTTKALQAYSDALKSFRSLSKDDAYHAWPRGVGLLINIGNFYTKSGKQEQGKIFYNEANEILKVSYGEIRGGGGDGNISILSDEDDLDKLLSSSPTESGSTIQEPKKEL